MRHASLKINRYAHHTPRVGIVNNNNLHVRVLRSLLLATLGLAICYVFILGSMVFNIVERRTLEADARTLLNEVGEMELSYLTRSNKVDLALGHSLGFKEARATFATRKAVGALDVVQVAKNDL